MSDEEIKELFDTTFTHDPVCPYCRHVQADAWEMSDGSNWCGACGKEFSLCRHETVSYSTAKIDGDENA